MLSASGPAFMFCAPELVFDGTEGVRSRFHILRPRTHCLQCRVRRVPFSCFARLNSVSAVPRPSVPIFMFCAPGLVFSGAECVGSHFHVLRYRSNFRQYRRRQFPFSCFAHPESFSSVPRASDFVFMFCAPRLIFDGTEGVRSRLYVFRARTHFLQYRGRRVPFSCFAFPDSFSTVPSASGPIFMFCAALPD
jgi:hypothetical protein